MLAKATHRPTSWLTSSDPEGKFPKADADYFANSLVSPVLFAEAMPRVPDNAIIVEIGAQPNLRLAVRKNKPNAQYVCVMEKGVDGVESVCRALAQLYVCGVSVRVDPVLERADDTQTEKEREKEGESEKEKEKEAGAKQHAHNRHHTHNKTQTQNNAQQRGCANTCSVQILGAPRLQKVVSWDHSEPIKMWRMPSVR